MRTYNIIKNALFGSFLLLSMPSYAYIDLQSALTAAFHSSTIIFIDVDLVIDYFEQNSDCEPIEGIFELRENNNYYYRAIVYNRTDNVWSIIKLGQSLTGNATIWRGYISKSGTTYYYNDKYINYTTMVSYNERYLEYRTSNVRTETYKRLTPIPSSKHLHHKDEQTKKTTQPNNTIANPSRKGPNAKPPLTK